MQEFKQLVTLASCGNNSCLQAGLPSGTAIIIVFKDLAKHTVIHIATIVHILAAKQACALDQQYRPVTPALQAAQTSRIWSSVNATWF